jgi:hypothetical protein
MAEVLLDGLAKVHQGRISASAGGSVLIVFEKAPAALACALAARARFAEHNRGKADEKLVRARLCVHWAAKLVDGSADERDAKILSALQEVTPDGRVFASRPVFTHSHGAQTCAFVPMGIEHMRGLTDPLDILEAVPAVAGFATLAPVFTTAGTGFTRPPARVHETEPEIASEPAAPPGPVLPALASGHGAAVAAAAGVLLFVAAGIIVTMLSPIDFLNYGVHQLAHAVLGDGEGAGVPAALVVQLLAPAALVLLALLRTEAWLAQGALFWLGQGLLSAGRRVAAAGGADPATFEGCVKNDGVALARALGLLKHYNGAAQLAALAGCLLMGAALVGAWSLARGGAKAKDGGT